jgi:putative SOS response-associated peptidase YedK
MCGRYVSPDTASIERAWHIGRINSNPFSRRFNVAPTTTIPLIRGNPATGALELIEARWGFVPSWWKEPKPPQHSFNARSEEAATKVMWRQSYKYSRCLVPAEGWYEWQAVESTDARTGEIHTLKQPHFIFRRDKKLLCFAGLMSAWVTGGDSAKVTCAILTRNAAPSVIGIHDRMPVVMPTKEFDRWLSPDVTSANDVAALVATADGNFEHYPVSTRLNTAKNDDEKLLQPV